MLNSRGQQLVICENVGRFIMKIVNGLILPKYSEAIYIRLNKIRMTKTPKIIKDALIHNSQYLLIELLKIKPLSSVNLHICYILLHIGRFITDIYLYLV